MDRARLEQIPCVRDFLALDNDLDRFDYLADLALFAPGLEAAECTEEARIPGCDSGLYYRLTHEREQICLIVQSGSLFVKGLGAMLAAVMDDCPFCDPCGLADLLFDRGLIPPERRRGLAELEARVSALIRDES